MKKYLKIYEDIKKEIISGAIGYGQKLKSKRTLAEDEGVSVITVELAYDLLYSEGYIESKERSGYYCVYKKGHMYLPNDIEKESERNTSFMIKNEGISFNVLAKTIRKVLSDKGESVMQKSPNGGESCLKLAIKNYLLRNRNIEVDLEQIIIGSGAEYLYGLVISLFGKNAVFGIEKPSYRQIENVYKSLGAKYEQLLLTENGISEQSLVKTCATVLHVTPCRSYPTGISVNYAKKRAYIEWAKKCDRYIIEDDYDSEFSFSGKIPQTIFSMAGGEHVIYINTFSKTVCPSLRAGYMILPKSLVKSFNEKLGFYSCPVPTLEQFVLTELLNGGEFERHINKIRRLRKKETENTKTNRKSLLF